MCLKDWLLFLSLCNSSKEFGLHNSEGPSALKRDNRVSFGSFEEHWVVVVTRKYSWKIICRCCHLSPDKAWQAAQYNLCAWHLEKSKWGLTAVTKLGQTCSTWSVRHQMKVILDSHFTTWRVYEKHHSCCPVILIALGQLDYADPSRLSTYCTSNTVETLM